MTESNGGASADPKARAQAGDGWTHLIAVGAILALAATSTVLAQDAYEAYRASRIPSAVAHGAAAAACVLAAYLATFIHLRGRRRDAQALGKILGLGRDRQRMTDVLDRTSTGLAIIAPDTRLQWANSGFLRLAGPIGPGTRLDRHLAALGPTGEEAADALRAALAAGGGAVEVSRREGSEDLQVTWRVVGPTGTGEEFLLEATDASTLRRLERKAAETARTWDLLQSHGELGIHEIHPERAIYRFSRQWKEVLGYRGEELPDSSATLHDRLHPDDARWLLHSVRPERAGVRAFTHDFRLRHQDGTWLWIRSLGVEEHGPDGRLRRSFGVSFNVTRERRLRDRLERARAALDRCGVVTIERGTEPGWPLRQVAKTMQVFGYNSEEMEQRRQRYLDLVAPEDRVRLQSEFEASVLQGFEAGEFEYELIAGDGARRSVVERAFFARDVSGGIASVDCFLLDVTAQRRAQDALRRSHQTLADIAAAFPGVLFRLERGPEGKGRFPYLSNGARTLWAADLAALEQSDEPLRKLLGPEGSRWLDVRPGPVSGQFAATGADGRRRWFRVAGTAVEEAHGRLVFSGMAVDITAEVRHRQEAQDLQAATESRSRARSEFLAFMSHEIRVPMQGVLGFAQLLAERPLGADEAEWAKVILDQVQQATRLLGSILDFSKLEEGRMEFEIVPVHLGDEVRSVCDGMRSVAESKRLDMTLHVESDGDRRVLADPLRWRQIVSNLVGNAVKFTQHGRVAVVLREREVEPGGGPRERTRFVLEVSDTGPGIPGDRLDRLFRRFSQADASTARHYGGSGLGLAIADRLVRQMGGTISVESAPGRGTTFTVDVPFEYAGDTAKPAPAAPPPARGAAVETAPDPDHLKQLAVAVVDDHAIARTVAQGLLRRAGAPTPRLFEDAISFLEAVQAEGLRFDLVLMDVRMPRMDGMEATRALLRYCLQSGIPAPVVVGLTADALPEVRDQCLASGMAIFLTKPTQLADIRRVVAAALEHRQSRSPGLAVPVLDRT